MRNFKGVAALFALIAMSVAPAIAAPRDHTTFTGFEPLKIVPESLGGGGCTFFASGVGTMPLTPAQHLMMATPNPKTRTFEIVHCAFPARDSHKQFTIVASNGSKCTLTITSPPLRNAWQEGAMKPVMRVTADGSCKTSQTEVRSIDRAVSYQIFAK